MTDKISNLTAGNFHEEVAASEIPVLVDFWAEWCGPCKMIAPVLEEIANEHPDSLRIVKVNVDEAPDLAKEFGVMSIPTLIVFKDGQPVESMVGARGKAQLVSAVSQYL